MVALEQGIFTPRLRSPPILDNLVDIMHHTVEHPLHVHFDLASQRQPISSLLGTDMAKDWFHNGEPLTIDLPCCWRVDLRDHRLGQRLVGGLHRDGQIFAARLGVVSAFFPQRTRVAVHLLCFISAVDVVANLVPTGCQFEDFSRRACVTIVLWVVGTICERTRLSGVGLLTSLGGKARITGPNMGIRTIDIQLLARTCLHVPFAMIGTVGTEAPAGKVICRQTDRLHGGFGSLHPRRHMPIILAGAKCFGMADDLMFRIAAGLGLIPLNDPMGGLHAGRIMIGDMTLQLFPPLAPPWFALREKVLDARRLFRDALNLLLPLGRLIVRCRAAGSCPLLICSGVRLQ